MRGASGQTREPPQNVPPCRIVLLSDCQFTVSAEADVILAAISDAE